MDEGLAWGNLFFSDNPPQFVGELDGNPTFRHFLPEDEQWQLGGLADKTRLIDATRIQVFWLHCHRRRKYVAKVVGACIKHAIGGELILFSSFLITPQRRLYISFRPLACLDLRSSLR